MRLVRSKWNIFVLAFTLGISSGCSKNSVESDPRIPAPGQVIVLSVTSVEPDNILRNGDFSEWYAGLNFPADFSEPLSPEISQTSRALMEDVDGEKRRGAHQVWHSSDLQEHPENQWGTTVNLAKNQLYTFRTYAKIEGDIIPVVQAWDVNDPKRPRLLDPEVVRVEPGPGPQFIEGIFKTEIGGSTRVCSYLTPSSPTEGSVLWYDWHLHQNSGSVPSPRLPSEVPLLVSSALDQLGKQIEVYGGNESWDERADHAREIFERMVVGLKQAKKEVLTTEDGIAVTYNDARFARESGGLVIDPGPPMLFRPFWTQLIHSHDELKSKGITLVCVPVPHRLSVYPELALLDWHHKGPLTDDYFYLSQSLLDRDIPIANIASEFLNLKEQGQDVYFKNSSILSGTAHQALGNSIAATVRGLYPDLGHSSTLSYGLESIALEIPTIQVDESKADTLDQTAPRTQDVLSVRAPDGTELKLDASNSVLAVGRIAHDYVRYSASWPFHTSHALGVPIRLYDGNVKDQDVLKTLLEDHALLSEIKIVVFSFPEEKLLF